jgi:hypothetical protein
VPQKKGKLSENRLGKVLHPELSDGRAFFIVLEKSKRSEDKAWSGSFVTSPVPLPGPRIVGRPKGWWEHVYARRVDRRKTLYNIVFSPKVGGGPLVILCHPYRQWAVQRQSFERVPDLKESQRRIDGKESAGSGIEPRRPKCTSRLKIIILQQDANSVGFDASKFDMTSSTKPMPTASVRRGLSDSIVGA